jgi:amidohydrolase
MPSFEQSVLNAVAGRNESLSATRRHLHRNPEPSRLEHQTSAYIARRLQEGGVDSRLLAGGTGVIAELAWGACDDQSPTIALRADIDALQLQDMKSCDYKSQKDGLCHACGHDCHTTIVLEAMLTVAGLIRDGVTPPTPFRLRSLFQPAEEVGEGAVSLVQQGAMDGVSAILGLHVEPELPAGNVGVRYGALTANLDEVEITVTGRGGHSARPHYTDDPIAASVQLLSAFYMLLPRSVDSRSPSVLSIGKISGGKLCNVIPDRVEMLGTLRNVDHTIRATLQRRMHEIARGIEEATGANIELRFTCPLDAVINDKTVTASLHAAAKSVVGDAGVKVLDWPSLGAEDFGGYLVKAPGAMLRLGCARPGEKWPQLHAPNFDIDEKALTIGAQIFLLGAAHFAAEGVKK